MMQMPLILPQIVALDVLFALVACLQAIHVPLIASFVLQPQSDLRL